jgi:hypothetical protein
MSCVLMELQKLRIKEAEAWYKMLSSHSGGYEFTSSALYSDESQSKFRGTYGFHLQRRTQARSQHESAIKQSKQVDIHQTYVALYPRR